MFKFSKEILKCRLKKILFLKLRVILGLEINNIAKRLKLSSKNIKTYKKRWGGITKFINPKWFQVFEAISGVSDINYVAQDIFYGIIEPKLNNRSLALAHADKNSYDKYYSINPFPRNLVRNIHGIFLNSDYQLISEKDFPLFLKGRDRVLVKPSIESSQGRNIRIFTKDISGSFYDSSGDRLTIDYINRKYKKNYVVQEYVQQHPYFTQFNESSLNCARIFTYRSVTTNKVTVLGSLLKFGKGGSFIDNQSAGGICSEIDANGYLNRYGTDILGNKYHTFGNNRKFYEAGPVHKIEEMKKIAVKIASENYHFRLIGIDICVDSDDKPVIIEVNNNYLGINFHQMAGRSLFKEFTDEVIDYCARRR